MLLLQCLSVYYRRRCINKKKRRIRRDRVAGDLARVVQGLKVEGTAHLGHGQGHLLQPLYKPSCCLLCLLMVPVGNILHFIPDSLETTKKSPESGIANTIILMCDSHFTLQSGVWSQL